MLWSTDRLRSYFRLRLPPLIFKITQQILSDRLNMFTHGVDRKTGLPSCNIPRVSLPGQKLATLSISQQFVRNDARYLSHEVCATAIQLALSIKVIFVSAFQFLGLSIGFISRLLVRIGHWFEVVKVDSLSK